MKRVYATSKFIFKNSCNSQITLDQGFFLSYKVSGQKIKSGLRLSDMSFSSHLTTGITTSGLLYNFLVSCLSKVHVAFSGPLSTRNVTSDEITVVMARQFQIVKQNCWGKALN